jgi:uncharacterized membrane protein (DUF373 family)
VEALLLRLYSTLTRILLGLALLALLIGVAVEALQVLGELARGLAERGLPIDLKALVTNVFSLIVVLELVRVFIEYFEHERVRLEILLEVGVAFLVRKMLLGLFTQSLHGLELLIWSSSLLLLVIARSLAVRFSPRRKLD